MYHNRNPHDNRKTQKRFSLAPDQQEEGQTLRQIEQCLAQDPPEIAKTHVVKLKKLDIKGEPNKFGIVVPEENAEALANEKTVLIKLGSRVYFVEAITQNEEGEHVLVCADKPKWQRDRTGRGASFHHGESGDYYAQISCEEAKGSFFYKIKVHSRKKNKDVFKQVANEGWESTLTRAQREADNMIARCRASDHKKKQVGAAAAGRADLAAA
ncbi:MAG: hypothetical protein ISN26_01425 [Betaproteobacteria bacterium AqS2]|uniref:Uncharacterized protein n=1 Tax=Candidatus Amphirhobacter heronislandensis TaxID=1732024 RepID=A0A930UH30_9GAMM|nr:hypothetical protein [Betaproteobacteria bacterium AqS2]